MESQTSRLAWVDGWRTVALALVLLDHVSGNKKIDALYHAHGVHFLADYGEVGVFIFFFISGYVVSRACLAEVARSGGFDAAGFYIRRLFRIAPPLMLYLAVCAWFAAQGVIEFSATDFFGAALYLCNTTTLSDSCSWYAGHTWSLAFEEQFYLLFALVFLWLELRRAPRPQWALGVLAIVALPAVFTIWWIGKTGFVIAYALFFAGYAAAKHGEAFLARLGPWRRETLLLSAAIVFLPRALVASFGDDESARAALIDALRLAEIVAVPALVMASGTLVWTNRLLSKPAISGFGRATYSVYLWQQLFTGAPLNRLDILPQLALIAAMAAFCLALYPRWELKLIDLGRRLALARKRAPTGMTSPLPPACEIS